MKMKKVISISLLCLFLIALTVTSASAINAKTQDQINEWLIYERTHPTQYGGGNCVDFCNHYLTDFWGTSFMWGNANDWRCPDGFTEIDVHSDINQLKPGDIIQEIYGDYGHVCVFCGIENGQAMVIDQATGSYAISQYHQWWGPFENQTRVYRGPTDTVKPRISNVKVTHITSEGYTVSCNVSDNVGVTRVAFPTWTSQKGQDDITDPWPDGSLNNGVATYSVRVSDHNNERDCEYITHIYAYDAAGNFECVATSANVPGTRGSEMRTGYSRTLADGDYFIVPTENFGYFLDIYGSDVPANNGTKVVLWSVDRSNIQSCDIWSISYSGGFYTIRQKGSKKCLDVEEDNGSKYKSGTKVQVWESTGSSNQQWAISKNGNGYRLQARCSGLSLDIAGGKMTNDTKIQQYTGNDSAAQRWTFLPLKDGKITFPGTPEPTATPKSDNGIIIPEPEMTDDDYGEDDISFINVKVYSDTDYYQVGVPITFKADILDGTPPYSIHWSVEESQVREGNSPLDQYIQSHPDFQFSTHYNSIDRHVEFTFIPPVISTTLFATISIRDANGMMNDTIEDVTWVEPSTDPYDDSSNESLDRNAINGYLLSSGRSVSVGDVVAFGEYEQDNNPNNGNEPIEWMVLDKRDGKVLLLSRYALEAVRYHNGYEKVSWETCYLRRWLNNEFYDAAFSNNEKAHIFESFLDNSETELSIRQGFSQGNDTYDKVFVLSPKEMEKYSLVGRRCYGTEHALAAGIGNLGGSGECWGWLRLSRYKTEQYAAREELVVRASSFYYAGNIDDYSGIPTNRGGICPAIWVCLND